MSNYSIPAPAWCVRQINLLNAVRLLLALSLVTQTACIAPKLSVEMIARSYGLGRSLLAGEPFQHVIYFNHSVDGDPRLHIYIDNDGTPWLGRFLPAPDPTATRSLMLDLMREDRAPALYLGRPCYHGMARIPPCTATWWTDARYSEAVVASLARAIENWRGKHPANRITLIGHSGGGTLAVLLANRVPGVDAVITLAANLDVEAWARHHRYSPLQTSINPAQQPSIDLQILQLHYQGTNDIVVPARTTDRYFLHNPQAERISITGYGHQCCWALIWPTVLARLSSIGL